MISSVDDFQQALHRTAASVEAALEQLIPVPETAERRVVEAMRYATLKGGKRLRAFLVLETAALAGANPEAALQVAAAVECVHAYSLIHDDLPAMDDDDLRRGRPTTHIAFDQATAILAGDALQSLSFEILTKPELAVSAEIKIALCRALAQAIGANGMVGGQMLDLIAEKRIEFNISEQEAQSLGDIQAVLRLQALKTGALFRFAATSGPILAQSDCAQQPGTDFSAMKSSLTAYANALGLAFQIQDDLLDLQGEEGTTGKRLRKDRRAGKQTYIDYLGVDGAQKQAQHLIEQAKEALAPYGQPARVLQAAADFVVTRTC